MALQSSVPLEGEPASARGRYAFFVLAALAVFMAAIDSTIVAVALPTLAQDFNAPLTWVGWTLTANQLVQVVMLPVAGKLSDTLGRKRVYMACVAVFTVGSLLCCLAPSIWLLVLFRALGALGAGGLMPSSVGIISDQFRDRRAQMIGLLTSAFPLGGIIGPNLGGLLLEHFGWRWLFFINLPIGLLVLVGSHLLLSGHAGGSRPLRVDLRGIALFASGVVAVLYGMTELGASPDVIRNPFVWGLFVVGLLMLVVFVRHVRTADDPLVEFELLARNPYLAANIYNFLFGAAAFGFFSFIPYYAVVAYGLSPFESGAVLTPRGIISIAASALSSALLARTGYRWPMLLGTASISACLWLLAERWTEFSLGGLTLGEFWIMALVLTLGGMGMGLAVPASNNANLDMAPARAASLTGLRGMFRLVGGAVGVSSIALALTFFEDQAHGLATIFRVLTFVMFLSVPFTLMLPDGLQGRRREKAAKDKV